MWKMRAVRKRENGRAATEKDPELAEEEEEEDKSKTHVTDGTVFQVSVHNNSGPFRFRFYLVEARRGSSLGVLGAAFHFQPHCHQS